MAEKVGTSPTTGFIFMSFRLMVTVEVVDPSAMTGPEPVIDELAATAAPEVKVTFPSLFETGVTIERILISAFRELKAQIDTPEESVTEQALYEFEVPVSVAEKVGVSPSTAFPFTSRRVMVMVEVAAPSATTGEVPFMDDVVATTVPAIKVTDPPLLETGVTIERVLTSARRELSVHVEIPEASETEHTPYVFVVPESVAPKVGTSPETGLLLASLKVIVMEDVANPSAITGPEPVIDEFAATAPAEVKTTSEPVFTKGVEIDSVLVSAKCEARVQVEIPEAFEAEHVP